MKALLKNQKVRVGLVFSVTLTSLLAFNNCQKFTALPSSMSSGLATNSLSSTKEEDKLLGMLNDAADWSARLTNLNTDLSAKIQKEDDSSKKAKYIGFQDQLVQAAQKLDDSKEKILNQLQVQRLAISSNEVLSSVDYLVLALAEAKILETKVSVTAEINRVEEESIARDQQLGNQINNLETEFAAFQADVAKFKEQVNAKFKSLDDQISGLNNRLNLINQMLQDEIASSQAADAALAAALGDLRDFTQQQIVELTDQNAQLKADILAQKDLLGELFQSQEGVASLAGRLCAMDNQGNISDGRTQCTGNEPDLYGSAKCCLTLEAVDCGVLFPSEVQISARNQCNILVATVKNHNEQLKAIQEVDAKQTSLIAGLLDDVSNISKQLDILSTGYQLLSNAVNAITAKISNIDQRLLIVEFKASRAEAAAALNERADLNLAWIARRTTDVSNRFCEASVKQALDQFDYEAARENWHYCQERLDFLSQAKELTQLAKAYTNGLQSVNVDTPCAAVIGEKSAEDLTNQDLLNEDIFKQVQSQCSTGGAVVARAMMLNVVQLLNVIGPDFRTVQYMNKKAKIAQLLFFGKAISETSSAERAAFENVDPTDPAVAQTLYGKIERPFKKRYVETRLRTLAGTFPENPADMPATVAGFDTVYSVSEINSNSTPFFQRLAALELEGSCADCGFQVDKRANTDVVISRGGKARFAYPKDAQSLCPIQNDIVVMKNSDGKYYPYILNYDWMREDLKPYLRSGVHVPMANSASDITNGNFSYSGRYADYLVNRNGLGVAQLKSRLILTLTQPYGNTYPGRGQCIHSALVPVMRDQEWQAPSGSTDLISYLNNYSNSVVNNQCHYNMGSLSQVRTRLLTSAEKSRIHTFSGIVDTDSLNLRNKVSASTTQLTGNYWTLRDKVLAYGVNNQAVSKTEPFFGAAQSSSDQFVRAYHGLTQDVSVQECTPNE
jgi:hypothetical protein